VREALRLAVCFLACPLAAAGSELVIRFTTIQEVLRRQVFTQDGRKYVRGTPAARCSFAYLQNPAVGGAGGVVTVDAHFSGRSALNLLGACVGLGDSFDVVIRAMPYYQDGRLRLKDVRVEGKGRDGFYIRRVCASLAESLRTQFSYSILEEARKLLERKTADAGFGQELERFQVSAVRVTSDAVILTLDFTLVVK